MVKKKDISDSDIELFRSSIGQVKRIKQDRVLLKTIKPHSTPRHPHRNDQPGIKTVIESSVNHDLKTGDELYFKRSGIQQRVMERLRRGQIPVEKELDLHGMTALKAETTLKHFLSICQQDGYRCIKIIHGKGRGSVDRKPVLKNNVNQWLQTIDQILAFCSARPVDGGTGAVYVLLKKCYEEKT